MTATPSTSSPVRLVLWGAIVYLFYLYLRAPFTSLVAVFDDSYMFLRYAKHLSSGLGIAWNPDGGQTFGTTSIPYLLLVTICTGIFPAPGAVLLRSISFFLGLISLLLMARTVSRFSASTSLKSVRCSLALALAIIIPFPTLIQFQPNWLDPLTPQRQVLYLEDSSYLSNALTGMDTTLAIFFNTLLIYVVLLLRQSPNKKFAFLGGAIAAFCVMVRPDSGIIALLFPTLTILLLTTSQRLLNLLRFGSACALVLFGDILWKTILFGSALPLPYFVKLNGFYADFAGRSIWNGEIFLAAFVASTFVPLVIIFGCLASATWRIALSFLVPCVITIIWYLMSTVQFMGYFGRFYAPLFPFVVIAAGLMLDRHLQSNARKSFSSEVIQFGSAILLALLTLGSVIFMAARSARIAAESEFALRRENSDPFLSQGAPSQTWQEATLSLDRLLKQLPDSIVMAMTEHGFIGSQHPQKSIIDLTGLHDPEFATRGFRVESLVARAPDLVWFPEFQYVGMRRAIANSSLFLEHYRVFPNLFRFGLALRKDSVHLGQITKLLNLPT